MYSSVHDALRLISGKLSTTLIAEATLARLLTFAARYPELGQAQYLECRLGPTEHAQIDLLVSAATKFERRALQSALATGPDDRAGLSSLRRLMQRWSAPESALHDRVPLLWLEFDHLEREVDPAGNVCVCLAPAYLDPFAALPEQPARDLSPVVLESIDAVSGPRGSTADRQRLLTCIQALPRGAHWIHLSIMAARDPLQLKLYGVFPGAAVLPFLAEVGWAGDRARIAHWLDRLRLAARTGDWIYVDLPVSGMLDPTQAGLGLALGQQHVRMSQEQDPTHRALLDVLVEDGLCTAAQRDALITWPGRETRPVAGTPARPDAREIQRWLDIKLACPPSVPPQAKAYLGFAVRQVAAAGLTPAVGARPAPAALSTLRPAPRTI